jgi:y4mF family transcriptional regulator
MNTEEAGSLIRQRRKDLGVDQQTVAELGDVSIHTLSNIESGKGNPTLESLNRILDVLGLELVIRPKDTSTQ